MKFADLIKNWKGDIEINNVTYSADEARNLTIDFSVVDYEIKLHTAKKQEVKKAVPVITHDSKECRITVKAYMTRKSTPEFDFMLKWNKDTPMPLRTMTGTVVRETPGMVYMKLHGDITGKPVLTCMKCGRPITNPVSQFFGMGPECGGHNYVNPFLSDEELNAAVQKYRVSYVRNITWEGWIIKSAITEKEVV